MTPSRVWDDVPISLEVQSTTCQELIFVATSVGHKEPLRQRLPVLPEYFLQRRTPVCLDLRVLCTVLSLSPARRASM